MWFLLSVVACSGQPATDGTSDPGQFGGDDCENGADPDTPWFRDLDRDGYGDTSEVETGCVAPEGFVALGADCDDGDAAVHPGASEVCDGTDNDCDGANDEDFDQDGDGYAPCAPEGDCDDTNVAVHPGALEVCGDGVDNDCAGGDADCPPSGDFALSEIATEIYSDEENAAMARQIAVGDVDGDGTLDVFVDAEFANDGHGGGFVLYGPLSGTHRTEDVGYEAISSSASPTAGRSVAVGDLDGDGYADVEIGAPYADVVFIELGPIEADFELENASIQIQAEPYTMYGHGSDVADVDGDGAADLLVGAYQSSRGEHWSGSVFVDLGPLSDGEDVPTDGHDVELYGSSEYFRAGRVVKAGADMDGDGIGDLLVGGISYPDGVDLGGFALVEHGPLVSDSDFADADATLVGVVPGGVAGAGLAQGDLDGDGLADALVGAPVENPSGKPIVAWDGAAYVVSGSTTGTVELADADVVVRGTSGGYLGCALAVGDLDGDGRGELLVGAPFDADNAGAVLVYYDAMPGTWDDKGAPARLIGAEQDGAGSALLIADLDANGRDDLLVGAFVNSTGAHLAGALYVVDPF